MELSLTCTLSVRAISVLRMVSCTLLTDGFPASETVFEVGSFIYRLHLSIDHALAVSYRRDEYGGNARFVARITLAKGIPFYGFHVGYQIFLKIYMLNPIVMTRLADLLQQGAIMKRKFQPFEAHLQYLLQFMTDYNLYGCDYLDASNTYFRSPVPEKDELSPFPHLWHSQTIRSDFVTHDPALPRVSHCSIEVDICVQDIINRRKVKERLLHHNFVERESPISADVKLVYSMAGLWRDETSRRKRQLHWLKQDGSPFPPEVLGSMSADPRDLQTQGWIHEDEYRSEIQGLVAEEGVRVDGTKLNFDTFVASTDLERKVNTALQSVEDLYPSNLLPVLGLTLGPSQNQAMASDIDVDERKVLPAHPDDDDFFPDDSDEEALRELQLADGKTATVLNDSTDDDQKLRLDTSCGPSWQNFAGICRSGLSSGHLPSMCLSSTLLNAAEDEGLLGRKPKTEMVEPCMLSGHKRGYFRMSSSESPRKRGKSDHTMVSNWNSNQMSTKPSVFRSVSPAKSRITKQSSQAKSKPTDIESGTHDNQVLNFAIVKGHQVPSTRSSLSQKSQTPTSSQQSKKEQTSKQVSFSSHTIASPKGFPPSQTQTAGLVTNYGPLPCLASLFRQALFSFSNRQAIMFLPLPPTTGEVWGTGAPNLPCVAYQNAFYGDEADVPPQPREYAGREFRLESNTLPFLPNFDPTGLPPDMHDFSSEFLRDPRSFDKVKKDDRARCSWKSWEFAKLPPTRQGVGDWWLEESAKFHSKTGCTVNAARNPFLSQIDTATPKNKHGFKYSQKSKSTSVQHEVQYMTTMSLEIHVNTRGKFVPNPDEDEIQCAIWALKLDDAAINSQESLEVIKTGIVILCQDRTLWQKISKTASGEVIAEDTELDLIDRMIDIVRTHDPDILTGYEVHGSSWVYLIERARHEYDYNLCDEFSRMKSQSHGRFGKENDRWGFNTTSTIRVTGRHMINIWRAMRGELNLLQYSVENVAWHLLHRRIPHYSWATLTKWHKSGKNRDLSKLIQYYETRARLDLEILEANELIARTSEQARLLGVDFYSVFSRGSQFKVESIMFRIAKPENFILVSPSRKQVGEQNALECLPLVMEPQSAFYSSPVLVLDFQSLYPSVMIAYNYCYSTFLGRITNWRGMNKMGFTEYKRQQGLLSLLKNYISIAPNGMMYTKAEIRRSLLAKMLTEILETRVMVKSGMKKDKDDRRLQQLLNNRQLALKLLANVTYGYTSASFSGRMPCSEIADSIVQTGRETLEKAIAYIHSVERWGAEVVYGDTDSLFVHLKGKTRDQAFDIGNEITRDVTNMNPRPVKLKFEKVYHPCVLLAKKRYVGYKYETRDQARPEFDAKGIETVRRDGTPAEQKMEEKALKILFETADLSQIKAYFQKQCDKIMRGAVSVQDFCFAREVRLGTYSDKGLPPAGALISTKKMLQDARAEPQYGERVPYVVITGAPGARLIDRSVAPEDLLRNPHWRLDAEYYIAKTLIPPLERIFNLVGANVRQWYEEMPKVRRMHQTGNVGVKKATLESYMKSTHCVVCNAKFTSQSEDALCPSCRRDTPLSLVRLQTKLTTEERRYEEVLSLCRSCAGLSPLEEVLCDSKDCPVFWTRVKQHARVRAERTHTEPVLRGLVDEVERLSLDW